MKNKIIAIAVCIAVIVMSIVIPAYCLPDENARYEQHISATLRPEDEADDGTFNTHLPLIVIDTGGEEIPGTAVEDPNTGEDLRDENGRHIWSVAADGMTTIAARMELIDNQDTVNRLNDEPAVSSDIRIRVRGNSSRLFDKKNYFIRLVNGEKDNDQSLVGMDSHSEWALHGPILDKTLIRNYLAYNISAQVMGYAPNVRFCELMLDGEYQGLYLLTETITAGKSTGERLDIKVNKKKGTYSGYLLRLDRPFLDDTDKANVFTAYTLRTPNEYEIMYPGKNNLTEEMTGYISKDFSRFEKSLYSYDYKSSEYGYSAYIDVDSFVDYFILNEFSCNYDAGSYSTYIYKGLDGKYRLCVWDFNNAFDNYQERGFDVDTGFNLISKPWYFMLMRDEDFVDRIISRYKYLRKGVLSDEYLQDYIDSVIEYLGPAIERNFEKWGYSFEDRYLLYPSYRNLRSYDEAVEQLKSFIHDRGEWLDENIDALEQYAKDAKNRKFNESGH